jgi:hypothetical protein
MDERLRKWAALATVLVAMLASGVAFGQDPGPCYEAYLESGLTEQQMTFDHFQRFYGDTLCAPSGNGLVASREGQFSEETR